MKGDELIVKLTAQEGKKVSKKEIQEIGKYVNLKNYLDEILAKRNKLKSTYLIPKSRSNYVVY